MKRQGMLQIIFLHVTECELENAGKDLCWLISKTVLLKEIEDNYDCDYGETLIDPRHFYDLVDEQQIIGIKNDWVTTKDKLPEMMLGILASI